MDEITRSLVCTNKSKCSQRSIDIVFDSSALSRDTRWKLSGKYLTLEQATRTLQKGNCKRFRGWSCLRDFSRISNRRGSTRFVDITVLGRCTPPWHIAPCIRLKWMHPISFLLLNQVYDIHRLRSRTPR